MNAIHTHTAFTRVGPQCAVCNAWKMPCPACTVSPAAVISEAVLLRTLIGYEYPMVDAMVADVVRVGALDKRVNRAKKVLGLVEIEQAAIPAIVAS